MHKRTKQMVSGLLAACMLSTTALGNLTAFAADNAAADSGWPAVRYELEDGRTFTGTGATQEIAIKTGGRFSGGKAVDTLDKNGDGAGVAIEPQVTENGLYQVVLGYSKGRAYPEGKIALYKNETRVGYFEMTTTGTTPGSEPVVDSDPLVVRLEDGDELSLRADTGESTDPVACFDYLDVSVWGGRYEAENAALLLDSMKTVDTENASAGKAVDGFEKTDGAGVEFPFVIPADDTYFVTLGYTRINYELADQIGLYVNGSRAEEIVLKSGGNTGDYISSDPVEISLKQGDVISVKESAADGDQGLLLMDYLEIKPKTEVVETDASPRFSSRVLRVMAGDVITVPVQNVPEQTQLRYESSDPAVAAVDAESGLITAAATGEAVITASGEGISFSCKVQVVESEDQLEVPVAKYEAEEGELVSGDKADPVIKSGSPFSGGKWVEIYDAGTGAAVKITPDITEKGEYALTMAYGKGSMYPDDNVAVYVNSKKVGEFKLQNNHLTEIWDTNTIVTELKPGDVVMVRKDAGMNSLFRYDYLKVAPVTAVPPRAITMEQDTLTLADKETCEVPYTLSPANASDDLVWSSSDPAVAEADGGVVWARGEGEATITAKSVYNDKIQTSVKVVVTPNDKIETIASSDMQVMLDRTYPRVMQYTMTGSGSTMDGNTQPLDTILLNGTEYKPEVQFEKKAEDTVIYTITVPELEATLTLQAKVEGTVLKFDFLSIQESSDKAKRIFTIELPDQNLVSVSSREETAEFAGSKMQPDITKNGDEFIDLTKGEAAAPTNYNYAFISNGKVAAGIRSNAYSTSDGDQGAPRRVIKETVAEGSAWRTSLRSGSWVWRRDDYTKKFLDYEGKYGNAGEVVTKTYEDTPNTNDMPLVYVVLAEDLNGTDTVDWQDAAIRFRDVMEMAIGMDKIPDAVVQRLIMPQAGEGNYPFISSLDETKRVYLNTDGLGQIILDKYHNLGFWGDFSVYDDHLGGLQDFRKFVSDATNKYNGFVGVHSNFTEVFAKTNQFSTESIQMSADGLQPQSKGYKAFGFFLHQCYYADDTWEALSGQRRDAIRMFKEDVPDLGFIYSDVYYWNGWRGQRLIDDYTANDLAYFVEWPYISEEAAVWAHWAVEKDYSPASNKGYSSDIARFIFNHTKDRWDNNASKCDGERVPSSCNLLMGADTTSYEGWVHDGVNQYDYIITKVFDNNLPTKYMQHFPILRMDKDEEGWGQHIWFEDGVEVFLDENGKRTMTKDGKLIYTEDAYLLPWDEGDMQVENTEEEKEIKLYHWNENGGDTTWELPDSWEGLANVYLYRLTDQGKVDQQVIPVENGSITLRGIQARTPYVVYKGEAAPTEDVAYGDGTFVKDPGFNYGDLRAWSLDKGNAEVRRNDNEGDDATTLNKYDGNLRNYELVVEDTAAAQVSQTVTGLVPGEEYAASVMVEVEQGKEREASIQVDSGDVSVKNYTTKSILRQYDAYDSKASTYMLRMRVTFRVPEDQTSATIKLCVAEGEGKVRFDNVRVYDTTTPTPPEDAENVVFYQDFEYGKRENAETRAENKVTFESYYPFNLGAAGGIREARAMLQTRHDPYTQNNANAGWDENTIMVDMALDGNHSLSIITDSLGAAFQTTPQTIRFEKGHTYRISFLYQNALDDTFAFVLGADQNSEPIYQESLKATPAKTGSKTFQYEFTSTSDQTWFSINRIDRSVVVSENPNPFVIDNILVEDLTEQYDITVSETENVQVEAPAAAAAGQQVELRVNVTDPDREVDTVQVTAESGADIKVERVQEGMYSFEMPAEKVNVSVSLKARAADKTQLTAAIDLAQQKLENSYTPESWKPFAEALAAAVQVNGDEAALQSQVDEALATLTAAMQALERLPDEADKTVLNALLQAAASKLPEQYTAESWAVFESALTAAKQVAEDVTSAQETVDEAAAALLAAMDQLVPVETLPVDRSVLDALIAAAEAKNPADYTAESWQVLADALAAAKAVTEDASQDAVNTTRDVLAAALMQLTAPAAVDKTVLQELVATAEQYAEEDYTAESWKPFADALAAAKLVLADPDAAQDAVDAARTALENAMNALEKPAAVDKTALDALIETALEKVQDDYTADSWNVFHKALLAAQAVSADEDATQQQVDKALAALQAGLDQLVPAGTQVDKTALLAAIEQAKGLNRDEYTSESWSALADALAEAERVAALEDASQSQADQAAAALVQAIESLVKKPKADKTALEQAIRSAEEKQAADYTVDSWDVFQRALVNARAVNADPYALQAQVDQAAQQLEQAVKALVPVDAVTPNPDPGQGGDNSGSTGGSNANPNLPATGDSWPVWTAVALFAAAMTMGCAILRKRCR